MVADWAFGIQDENMQAMVDEVRGSGCRSSSSSANGMDVDLKMASRVQRASTPSSAATPMTACAGGDSGEERRRHDAGHQRRLQQQVLGVMDFDVKGGKVVDFRYRLLPVFANQIRAIRRWSR